MLACGLLRSLTHALCLVIASHCCRAHAASCAFVPVGGCVLHKRQAGVCGFIPRQPFAPSGCMPCTRCGVFVDARASANSSPDVIVWSPAQAQHMQRALAYGLFHSPRARLPFARSTAGVCLGVACTLLVVLGSGGAPEHTCAGLKTNHMPRVPLKRLLLPHFPACWSS